MGKVNSIDILAKYDNWLNKIEDEYIIERLSALTSDEKIEYFSNSLDFGTSGMRGIMRMGPNGINELTVSKLAKAVADYANKHYPNGKVVVCFDTRHNSYKFSRLFANVLDMEGVACALFKEFAPTPLCVFATTTLGACLGVMITASHNRKEYNGIKVYDHNGVSINDKIQQEITSIFNNTDEVAVYNKVRSRKLSRKVRFIKKDMLDKFVNRVYDKTSKDLKIIYTPLNGTGLYCVKKLLKNNRFNILTPDSQSFPDGDFSTCPYPNPEFIEAFDESLKLAQNTYADIIIATDPDADRLGVMVRHNNDYVKLSGNEVGYIFADYLLKDSHDKFVVTTVVTSPLIDDICKAYNARLFKTLTGFMSIGTKTKECIELLGAGSHALSYEESCGYVLRNDYFDKDGIFACLAICQIAQWLKNHDLTLVDYLDEIYSKIGYVADRTESIVFEGANASTKMQRTIEKIRNQKVDKILNKKIIRVVDYLNDDTGLPKQNFLRYEAEEFSFILRPSGTEPKLKIYMFFKCDKVDAENKLSMLYDDIKKIFFKD